MAKGINIIAGLRLNTSAFTSSLRGASVNLNQFTASSSKGMSSLGKIAGIAGVALIGLYKVMSNVVGITMEYSKSLSELKAVLQGTASDMKALDTQAQSLGASTVHTATEVVKLQTVLARFGFSKDQILATTKSVLNLGTAMNVSLDQAASLVGSTLKAFNLSAKDAAHVSDVLTKATTSTSLSFNKLKIALPYAATAADQYGVSLETTAALLGVLADKGLRASTMGTSVRKMFITLSNKGLDFNKVMSEIRDSSDSMAVAYKYFGLTAANTGVILADSKLKINELTGALEKADGATTRMANTMADNLSGDITLAKSAWQGFVLAVDNGSGTLSTALRTVTKSITKGLQGLADMNSIKDYYVLGAERIMGMADAQSLLNAEIKKMKDLYGKDTNGAIDKITALQEENAKVQEKINALSERSITNILPRIAKGRADKIRSLNANIIANNKLISTLRELSAESLGYVDTNKKSADEIAKENEEKLKAIEKAKLLREEHIKNIKTLETLRDAWYLLTLSSKDYKNEKLARWFSEENDKINALTLSTNKLSKARTDLFNSYVAQVTQSSTKDESTNDNALNVDNEISAIADSDAADNAIEDLSKVENAYITTMASIRSSMKETVSTVSILSSSFGILGRAISDSIEGQDQVFANVAVGVLKSINKIINGLLAEMVATLMAKGAAKGILGVALAAVTIPIAIGLINKNIASTKGKQNFATGGIVDGTSFSGDKIVAGLNSGEMVLNKTQQSELFALANGKGRRDSGEVEFTIRGDKLVGVLNNYNRKISKIR